MVDPEFAGRNRSRNPGFCERMGSGTLHPGIMGRAAPQKYHVTDIAALQAGWTGLNVKRAYLGEDIEPSRVQ